jgi:hypothetical protein
MGGHGVMILIFGALLICLHKWIEMAAEWLARRFLVLLGPPVAAVALGAAGRIVPATTPRKVGGDIESLSEERARERGPGWTLPCGYCLRLLVRACGARVEADGMTLASAVGATTLGYLAAWVFVQALGNHITMKTAHGWTLGSWMYGVSMCGLTVYVLAEYSVTMLRFGGLRWTSPRRWEPAWFGSWKLLGMSGLRVFGAMYVSEVLHAVMRHRTMSIAVYGVFFLCVLILSARYLKRMSIVGAGAGAAMGAASAYMFATGHLLPGCLLTAPLLAVSIWICAARSRQELVEQQMIAATS